MIGGGWAALGHRDTWFGRPGSGDVSYSSTASFDFMPALDGLRAVSIALVLVSHAGFGWVVPGGFGVSVFFFVSGLLITRQLAAELAMTGRIALGRFTMRRFLRLYPPMLAMLALGTAAFVAAGGSVLVGQVIAALLYFYNYGPVIFGWLNDPAHAHSPFDVLWSLAIEEHFYLLFPLLMLGLRRAGARVTLSIGALILAITAWRCFLASYCEGSATGLCIGGLPGRLEGLTDTKIDSILYGALLAVALDGAVAPKTLRLLRTPAAFWFGMVALLVSFAYRDPYFRETLRYTVQGLALILAVGGLLFSPALHGWRRMLSSPAARLIGRLSYSIYLWHWVVIVVALQLRFGEARPQSAEQLAWMRLALAPLAALSVALACLSYYGLERPVLRLRRRFGSHPVADTAAPAQPTA